MTRQVCSAHSRSWPPSGKEFRTLVPAWYLFAPPEPPANRHKLASCRDFNEGERRDSNPRPPGPQPGALPTELRPPCGPESSSGRAGCGAPAIIRP